MNRKLKDTLASKFMLLLTIATSAIVFLIMIVLFNRSLPILTTNSLGELLLSSSWRPQNGEFGFLPFIIGTVWVTAIAMVFAIPISILTAIYLVEYAPVRLQEIMKPLIDLLAGIPSVVYGLFGVLAIVPMTKILASSIGIATTGYSVLSGGIILTIMVFPIIISVSKEVFRAVPNEIREASLSLGATKWQTIKHAVVRVSLPGIIAAVVLGFSRAFGETMAVLMVVGNVPVAPSSVFDPAYPLPALIANSYGEMMSIPLYDSAILFAALILMLIVLLFNVAARFTLLKIERGYS